MDHRSELNDILFASRGTYTEAAASGTLKALNPSMRKSMLLGDTRGEMKLSARDEFNSIIEFAFMDRLVQGADKAAELYATGSKAIAETKLMGGGSRKIGQAYQEGADRFAGKAEEAAGSIERNTDNLTNHTVNGGEFTEEQTNRHIQSQDSHWDNQRINEGKSQRYQGKATAAFDQARKTRNLTIGGVAVAGGVGLYAATMPPRREFKAELRDIIQFASDKVIMDRATAYHPKLKKNVLISFMRQT